MSHNITLTVQSGDGSNGTVYYSVDGGSWQSSRIPGVGITYNTSLNIYTVADSGKCVAFFEIDYVNQTLTGLNVPNTSVTPTSNIIITFISTPVITYSGGAHGSISGSNPQSPSYWGGNCTAVTAVSNTGYHFVKWVSNLLGDVGTNPTRTDTNITASDTITAVFAINSYTVTSSTGANGSITPLGAQSVNYGSNQTFDIAANRHYKIDTVLVLVQRGGMLISSFGMCPIVTAVKWSAILSIAQHDWKGALSI